MGEPREHKDFEQQSAHMCSRWGLPHSGGMRRDSPVRMGFRNTAVRLHCLGGALAAMQGSSQACWLVGSLAARAW